MSVELVKHSPNAIKRYMTDMQISESDLASKTKIAESKIVAALNSDEKILKLTQLQKIAEKLFVPTIYLSTDKVFFERDIPELKEFRNLDDCYINPYKDRALTEELCSVRRDYLSVLEVLNEEPKEFSLNLVGNNSLEDAQSIIDYFGFYTYSKKITNNDDYFRDWRLLIEEKSILVIDKPKDDYCSDGVCLYFSQIPVIAILSTGQSYSRRLFTMIHELVHLGLGQSIFDGSNIYSSGHRLEKYCNEVAGNVLAPMNIVSEKFDSNLNLENNILSIRKVTKASKAAIAIQLKNLGYINNIDLKNYLEELKKKNTEFGGGPKKDALTLNYFGHGFVEKVMSAMWGDLLPTTTAKQILRFNENNNLESFNRLQSKVF